MTIVCLGELLIDFVAEEVGVTVGEAHFFEKMPGGAPANVAVAIERLGGQSAFIGQVGDDPFGRFLADVLEAEGVDIRGLRFTDQARTMLAFVSLAARGERSFSFYRNPSADMLLSPDSITPDLFDGAELFHFGSITLISEPSRSATLKAAQIARDRGLLISYDPNLRLNLWPDEASARAGMLAGLDYAHIVKISQGELNFLGGDVKALWRDPTNLIVVTDGESGAIAYTDAGETVAPGHPIESVDTTGAGDGFVAGLLMKILEHPRDYRSRLQSILCFANAVGALTCTQRGAIPALPARAQVEAFADCD